MLKALSSATHALHEPEDVPRKHSHKLACWHIAWCVSARCQISKYVGSSLRMKRINKLYAFCLFGEDAHQARVPSRYMDMADSRNTPRCTHGRKVEVACEVCTLFVSLMCRHNASIKVHAADIRISTHSALRRYCIQCLHKS